jgi:hypothetical protein
MWLNACKNTGLLVAERLKSCLEIDFEHGRDAFDAEGERLELGAFSRIQRFDRAGCVFDER